ncbi:MAG: hypothetical protein SW127_17405 [Actinomycetota bacterium]|nr:hypothetical protein [Actinomycetota bacterium]
MSWYERVRAVPRVTGADESYLLAEELFGLGAPMHFVWVFDRDPGVSAVQQLRAGLAAGSIHREVHRTSVPMARHRWVRSSAPAVGSDTDRIGDDEVGAWADARVRDTTLRPIQGAGWRLDSAAIGESGRVVSLLVSHMIADGHGVYRALAAAHAGEARPLPGPASAHGAWAVLADVVDAGRQLVDAASSLRIVVREAWRTRRATRPAPPQPIASDARPADGPETTLATVDVDRGQWRAQAEAHGGTSNSLFTALLAGIVQRSGYPRRPELRVCIAVDNRAGEPDERANASGGVWIRLSETVDAPGSLEGIRALSKQAFVDYAQSGADQVADNLQPIVRLLPRRLIARMMSTIPGPDTTVSNLGVAPEVALGLGGVRATSFGIRALMHGMPADRRRTHGPAIAAWAVEYHDRITLTFFGIHPDHFGDPDLVRKLIGEELSSWQLEHRFW